MFLLNIHSRLIQKLSNDILNHKEFRKIQRGKDESHIKILIYINRRPI